MTPTPTRVPHDHRAYGEVIVGLLPSFLLLLALQPARAQQPTADQPAHPELYTSGPPLPTTPIITFTFERVGLPVPNYTLSVGESTGRYLGTEVSRPTRNSQTAPAPQPFDRTFPISAQLFKKIVDLTHDLHNFNTTCASKLKNIADTGKKTLTYLGPQDPPPPQGSCTYNYADDKRVQTLTDIFEGLATTMDEGRRLDFMHRYDRLGLDAELGSFTQEVAEGHAIELATIARSLDSIKTDPELLQRARTRAAALLAQIQ